jgi:hypothetical protein
MSSEETEGASPQCGSHPHWAKGTLGTWRTHRQHGGRAQNRPFSRCQEVGRGCGQTRHRGAYVLQHLNLSPSGKVHGRNARASNRTTGNPAVRDYRGAAGNVSHGGTVNPSCYRKSRNGNPSPKARRACALSQPVNFLGFTHYCGKNHKTGYFMVVRKTIGKRMAAKLKKIRVRRDKPAWDRG